MDTTQLKLAPFLQSLVDNNGSDLHVKPGAPPRIRISGALVPLATSPLTADQCEAWILETMDDAIRQKFLSTNEADYAISASGIGRFRANAFRARGSVGFVCRLVGARPMRLDELGLPNVLSTLSMESRGLLLVTGPTGSGKTTTLAAMVDLINENKAVHILTIEDPIEVMHSDKMASVNQRELRTDTVDFNVALRSAMRQDPDVILIGEMRDVETVRAAVQAAETGHFVMSTLHTTDAAETIGRIIDFFPPHEQKQIRLALAASIKGIICQRLVPTPDGGRICVMEILVATERIREAIADVEKTATITELIAGGAHYGMQTFDQHLVQLVLKGQITASAAKVASSKPADLTVSLKQAGFDSRLIGNE